MFPLSIKVTTPNMHVWLQTFDNWIWCLLDFRHQERIVVGSCLQRRKRQCIYGLMVVEQESLLNGRVLRECHNFT